MQGRGQLTERVQQKAIELLNRETTVRELRLMPYVQYCVLNQTSIEPNRVNQEERDILLDWEISGFIEDWEARHPKVTKEFWDIMCELLYLAYVDLQ